MESEPATLCDLVEHDSWSRWLTENIIFETLLEEDHFSGELRPRLATLSRAGNRWTLALARNVRWHDGKDFSAADVLYTLNQARDPKLGADQRSDLEPVISMSAPDAHTVVLELGRPAPFLASALAHLMILPEHIVAGQSLREASFCRAPIGTGPYRFVSWKPQQEIVLEKNRDFRGRKANLDRLTFKIVRDRQVAFELHRRGELDLVWRVPPGRSAGLRSDAALAGDEVLRWTPRSFFAVVYNCKRLDQKTRRALSELTDRERLKEIALDGHALEITGPYAPGTPSYDPSVPAPAYAPDEAKKALAPLRGKHLSLVVPAGSRGSEQLGTLLKEALRPTGIELDIITVDFASQLDRLRKHDFDLAPLQLTVALEQDNYGLFHSKGGQNYGEFQNAAADQLMEKIRAATDDHERNVLEHQLHRLIASEQPYHFIAMPLTETLIKKTVLNVRPSADGFNFDAMWKVE
jgi:peptide/nickel transport system substrate-binding protein